MLFGILALLTSAYPLQAIEGAEVAVYMGIGAWTSGVIAFEHLLDWKGITHERIWDYHVNNTELADFYEAIYFPGGNAGEYNSVINSSGYRNIRDLVNGGGAYIGICAGAYFAADLIEWEGVGIDYPLDLFQGTATGSIHGIAPWPDYTMTSITLNPDNPMPPLSVFIIIELILSAVICMVASQPLGPTTTHTSST